MTNGNNLFGSDDQQKQTGSTLSYIGDGLKYSTVDELDKAYGNANEHIGTLEGENKDLKDKISLMESQGSAVDKVLDALKESKTVQDTDSQDQASDHRQVDEGKLKEMISDVLSNRDTENKRDGNLSKVKEELTRIYGDKASEVYKTKGKSLNVDLDSLSQASPEAVLALFKTTEQSQQSATSNSSFNTQSLSTGPEYGTHEYWQQQYTDKKITREEKFRQQHKSLTELGDKYWS